MSLLNAVNRAHLEKLYDQIDGPVIKEGDTIPTSKSLPTSLQYTGFAIMCKDLVEFLASRGYIADAVEVFRGAYNKALSVEYVYLAEFHPHAYGSLSMIEGLPAGLTESVAAENMDVSKLMDKDLVTKLSPLVGWFFFREYSAAMEGRILECLGEKGIPDVYEDRRNGAIDLAEKLLTKVVPNEFYWYPVILYLCILLFKTDFKTIS